MSKKIELEISLFNQDMMISCLEEERNLFEESKKIGEEQVAKIGTDIPSNHLSVVVCLNLAREIVELRKKSDQLDELKANESLLESNISEKISLLKNKLE